MMNENAERLFGERIILRDSARGIVIRTVTYAPHRLYLIWVQGGPERIVGDGDLWNVDEYREWIQREFKWDGVERRKGERRRRDDGHEGTASERRRAERRQQQLPVLHATMARTIVR